MFEKFPKAVLFQKIVLLFVLFFLPDAGECVKVWGWICWIILRNTINSATRRNWGVGNFEAPQSNQNWRNKTEKSLGSWHFRLQDFCVISAIKCSFRLSNRAGPCWYHDIDVICVVSVSNAPRRAFRGQNVTENDLLFSYIFSKVTSPVVCVAVMILSRAWCHIVVANHWKRMTKISNNPWCLREDSAEKFPEVFCFISRQVCFLTWSLKIVPVITEILVMKQLQTSVKWQFIKGTFTKELWSKKSILLRRDRGAGNFKSNA